MSDDGKDLTQEPSETTSEDQDPPQTESQESPTSTSQQDGSGTNIEEPTEILAGETLQFQHPLLAGKSPEEIERIFETQQSALDDVTREANEYHSRLQTQPTAPTPQEEEEDDPYGDDFLAPRFKTFEERITKTMAKMVEPLKQDINQRGATTVRDKLRGEYQHFTVLEPHIDRILREQGVVPDEANESQLRMIYHTAVGVAHEQGINLAQGTTTPTKEEKAPVSIPQHRPSSAPLPKAPEPQKRELSENEKRLAKEFFPESEKPEDDYRQMQDAEESDIVKPGFSQEGW